MLRNNVSLAKSQFGVSLIEVLVAIIVLGVGLLGLAGLQVSAMQNSQSSYLSSQAALMAYNIIDQARAQGGSLSTNDISEWNASLAALPSGSGTAEIESGKITVSISWIDAHWLEAPVAAAPENGDTDEGEEEEDDEEEETGNSAVADARITTFSMSSQL